MSADAAALFANIAAFRAPFWRNLGSKCSLEPSAGALWRKMRDNQETPGDDCDSCDKRLKFTVRSKTVAEVANVAPPTGDMPHRLASLTLFVR
jgi:hypothetical protein